MSTIITQEIADTENSFKQDVLKGLSSDPKHLDSKYFYDAQGDKLFQQIMTSPEYYLTDSEMEIFSSRCREMLSLVKRFQEGFDLIELGAGDALKSTELLRCLSNAHIDFRYFPIDISANIIQMLERELPQKIPGIRIEGIDAEYFAGLKLASQRSTRPRLVLFLGGNIGNMPPDVAGQFLLKLRQHLHTGDMALIGFDLKKNPWTIFRAYNDADGLTKEFNLNLLRRINRELGANFDAEQFEHYESYDPASGACNSYLISLCNQHVDLCGQQITFEENEYIFMETSHKYTPVQIDKLADQSGFQTIRHLFDRKQWFTDVIWESI
ncbi:L-histidine N(alpha)-methyltransferase [Desertivirga xinjiangensis]|uniref:L-histidine N(alpha)-methyltransferase n=1 Tax=Desertivirga xinjiangensis TaxID=539206 RepID=UPI00210ACE79|nr:L-histidine N(alpha)-methyltransferase [Pedobacter xinjiangensis]